MSINDCHDTIFGLEGEGLMFVEELQGVSLMVI
jgi:hypothetical protein